MNDFRANWNKYAALVLVVIALLRVFGSDGGTDGSWPKGPLEIVVVEETGDVAKLSRPQVAMLASVTLREQLTAKGHTFRRIDKDAKNASGQTPPELAPFIAAAGAALPAVVVRSKSGKIAVNPLPADEPALLALLGKYGG